MIKIAFIKFVGCAAGGTEKWLQAVAANLPKNEFEVDYFYCDTAPYIGSDYRHSDNDISRINYLKSKNINLIKFHVGAKNVTIPTHDWINTDFWDFFKEDKYDLVITGRAGHKEYPYYLINNVPIMEFITLPGMADNQNNIVKSIHISKFQANSWIAAGGNPSKVEIIPLFSELPKSLTKNLRKELSINKKQFVFGMHQRDNDEIFSSIPLHVYSNVEKNHDNVAFIIMGGSKKYREQAKDLGVKNFYALNSSGDYKEIGKFLATLNVFTHGRADGETYSLAIAEAMSYGLPIISHAAPAMGHVETIGDGGIVVNSIQEYCDEISKLMLNEEYYKMRSINAVNRFNNELSIDINLKKIVNIIHTIIENKKILNKLEKLSAEEYWDTLWDQ